MMSVPSISALTAGISFSAWQTALVKKPMKPSFTPCFFSNISLYLERRSITAFMSTSLKVVSMAAVCWASLRRRAIVWRRRVILTRSSRLSSSADDGARAAFGVSAGCEGAPRAIASITSPFSTWPRLPEPDTCSADTPFSAIILAADGAGGMSPPRSAVGGGPATSAVFSAASFVEPAADLPEAWATAPDSSLAASFFAAGLAGAPSPSAIMPSRAPTSTVSPS